MATLENVHGASLVPNLGNFIDPFVAGLERNRALEAQKAKQGQIDNLLSQIGGTGQTGSPTGATPGINGNKQQQQALLSLTQLSPEIAGAALKIVESGDQRQIQQAKAQTIKQLKEAFFIKNLPAGVERTKGYQSLILQAQRDGRPIDEYVRLAGLSEKDQEMELTRATVGGMLQKQFFEKAEAPKSREIKRGDQLVTQEFNSGTGQYQDIATSDRFKSDILSAEAESQKARIARAGSTSISVGGTNESEEHKKIAAVRANQFQRVLEEGEKAESMIESLDQLDAINVDTGALEPAKASLAAVVEGFGIDASGIANIGTAQAYRAASNRLVNNVLNQAKGPQTEGDAKRARSTIANLGDSPLAAQFKTDSLRAVALRAVEQRDFTENLVDQGETFTSARKQWREFKAETPSLSAAIKNPQTGLPIYFYQFKKLAAQRRPGISDQEVINAWRKANARR